MKRNILKVSGAVMALFLVLCTPAFAIEESEVENAIAASSNEAVAGNIFLWFLCAVAFLKNQSEDRQLPRRARSQCRAHWRKHADRTADCRQSDRRRRKRA